MKRAKRLIAVASLALALSACGTYVKIRQLGPLFPPTSSCEVFATQAPDRPYYELALIEVGAGGNTIAVAQKKAMALGANAIVMKGQAAEGSMVLAGGLVGTVNKTMFVAIRWKD